MQKILDEIVKERDYQKTKFGVDCDDQNTQNDWVAYIATYAGMATTASRNTARCGCSGGTFREMMLKVATLAVAAIEAEDRK